MTLPIQFMKCTQLRELFNCRDIINFMCVYIYIYLFGKVHCAKTINLTVVNIRPKPKHDAC